MGEVREFRLPDLGEGLEEGEIVAWHVEAGDTVELNQTVVDVETAKAVVEVPCPFAGTVVERLGEVGETLEVGSPLLLVEATATAEGGAGAGAADAAEAASSSDAVADADAGSVDEDVDEEPQPLVGYGQGKAGARRGRRRGRRGPARTAETDGRAADRDGSAGGQPQPEPEEASVLAKPPVRRLAKDLGVELSSLAPGSGPDGVITREDVRAAAEGGPAPAAAAPPAETGPAPGSGPPGFRGRRPGEVEEIRGIRRRIVERMETSRREIPEATCSRDADLTELWAVAAELTEHARRQGREVTVTPFALVCRAAVLALRRFPTVNARIDREAGRIELLEPIHLGVAVDTDRGLLVPVVHDAHVRSVADLASTIADLAERGRAGRLAPRELVGGTFTVNNYGAFGNDDGDPVINHPEGALLGLGAARERPWVVDGELAVRRVATLRLAFDHRICDGGEAGRFVTEVARLCEAPTRLLLDA